MTDVFPPDKRRWIMAQVRNKDTAPEVAVRSVIHRMGFRFRLHARDLPGRPDIVLPRHRKVVFVHGCFWHGHEGCPRARRPASNVEFWRDKLDANLKRDREVRGKLRKLGWKVMVVWTCELHNPAKLARRLRRFLER